MVHALTRATSNSEEISFLSSQTQFFVSGERKPLSDNDSRCSFKQTSGQFCDHLRPPTWCSLHRCASRTLVAKLKILTQGPTSFGKKHSSAHACWVTIDCAWFSCLVLHFISKITFLYALATTSNDVRDSRSTHSLAWRDHRGVQNNAYKQ